MYIETSAPRVQGDKARLRSPTFPATNGQCLTFWYHMYGPNIGTLNLYTSSFNNLGKPIWTMSGNQGNKWLKAQLSVQKQTQFQVELHLNKLCKLNKLLLVE